MAGKEAYGEVKIAGKQPQPVPSQPPTATREDGFQYPSLLSRFSNQHGWPDVTDYFENLSLRKIVRCC